MINAAHKDADPHAPSEIMELIADIKNLTNELKDQELSSRNKDEAPACFPSRPPRLRGEKNSVKQTIGYRENSSAAGGYNG